MIKKLKFEIKFSEGAQMFHTKTVEYPYNLTKYYTNGNNVKFIWGNRTVSFQTGFVDVYDLNGKMELGTVGRYDNGMYLLFGMDNLCIEYEQNINKNLFS